MSEPATAATAADWDEMTSCAWPARLERRSGLRAMEAFHGVFVADDPARALKRHAGERWPLGCPGTWFVRLYPLGLSEAEAEALPPARRDVYRPLRRQTPEDVCERRRATAESLMCCEVAFTQVGFCEVTAADGRAFLTDVTLYLDDSRRLFAYEAQRGVLHEVCRSFESLGVYGLSCCEFVYRTPWWTESEDLPPSLRGGLFVTSASVLARAEVRALLERDAEGRRAIERLPVAAQRRLVNAVQREFGVGPLDGRLLISLLTEHAEPAVIVPARRLRGLWALPAPDWERPRLMVEISTPGFAPEALYLLRYVSSLRQYWPFNRMSNGDFQTCWRTITERLCCPWYLLGAVVEPDACDGHLTVEHVVVVDCFGVVYTMPTTQNHVVLRRLADDLPMFFRCGLLRVRAFPFRAERGPSRRRRLEDEPICSHRLDRLDDNEHAGEPLTRRRRELYWQWMRRAAETRLSSGGEQWDQRDGGAESYDEHMRAPSDFGAAVEACRQLALSWFVNIFARRAGATAPPPPPREESSAGAAPPPPPPSTAERAAPRRAEAGARLKWEERWSTDSDADDEDDERDGEDDDADERPSLWEADEYVHVLEPVSATTVGEALALRYFTNVRYARVCRDRESIKRPPFVELHMAATRPPVRLFYPKGRGDGAPDAPSPPPVPRREAAAAARRPRGALGGAP